MFGFFKKKKNQEPADKIINAEVVKLIEDIHRRSRIVYGVNEIKQLEEYQDLQARSVEDRKAIVLAILDQYMALMIRRGSSKSYGYSSADYLGYGQDIMQALLAGLLRRKLDYSEDEWIELFGMYGHLSNEMENYPDLYFSLSRLPINHSIKQIEYFLKGKEPSPNLKKFMAEVLKLQELRDGSNSDYGSDLKKSAQKLRALISDGDAIAHFKFKPDDIGPQITEIINDIKAKEAEYSRIFFLATAVSGSKPNAKFLKSLNAQLDSIGLDNYRRTVHKLLLVPVNQKFESTVHTYEWNGNTHENVETKFLCSDSQVFVKGLVWTCNRFSDKETIQILTRLAEKCYTKIPGKGPAAASIGNACVYVLGNMKGKDGLGALSRLKLKVRQNNVKKTIDKLLLAGADKYNISVEELKEMAVPSYKLDAGAKRIAFADYNLDIKLVGTKVIQSWTKPDGAQMKSVPSIVKNTPALKKKLQAVRKEVKEIQKVYSAQKQRIDNQFILDRTWDYTSFEKYYLDHGLVSPIAIKLIWSFASAGKKADAILVNGVWTTIDDEKVDWINSETKVKLWHPIFSDETTIVKWREKMMSLEWKQPIKQAYRELYILTDAELNTKSYSNRMAAHILKQHQFNTLASIRNWKYSLMGWYDDGRDNEVCSKKLPEHKMTAEFWIDELAQDESYNDTGIWLYVATDQVKFKDENDDTIDLVDIPKIVFTEVMRDVDMFVGVGSVGNDPQWMDNNGERQTNRDYWQSYSFGDLSEIAKTRKEILQRLLPRLKKIRDISTIEGKFLIVKGKVRTYKIHIGSGNILMEPNDQYLCIVPSRSAEKSTGNLFIPFEGDRGLSIVLSKAFLLAEDDKIDDSTILSQINGT